MKTKLEFVVSWLNDISKGLILAGLIRFLTEKNFIDYPAFILIGLSVLFFLLGYILAKDEEEK